MLSRLEEREDETEAWRRGDGDELDMATPRVGREVDGSARGERASVDVCAISASARKVLDCLRRPLRTLSLRKMRSQPTTRTCDVGGLRLLVSNTMRVRYARSARKHPSPVSMLDNQSSTGNVSRAHCSVTRPHRDLRLNVGQPTDDPDLNL